MKCVCYFLIFFFFTQPLLAQFPALQFSTISVDDGLSNRVVTTIFQDSEGFIWAGTNDGLNRLDGYRIKKFYYEPNSISLPNNVISQITGNQNIYISTESGIIQYNIATKNFQLATIGHNSLRNTFKATLLEDKEKKGVWICVNDSLYLLQNQQIQNIAVQMPNELHAFKQKRIKNYTAITKDANLNYWAWSDCYLFKVDSNTMQVQQYFAIGTHAHDGILFALPDATNKNLLWIGTWNNGLFLFDAITHQSKLICLDNTVVHAIKFYTDILGNKWLIAATNKGITLINPTTFAVKDYAIGESLGLLVDKQNILWIACADGIKYIDPKKQLFNKIHLSACISPFANNAEQNLPITFSVVKNSYHVGMFYGRGLAVFNKQMQLKQYIPSIYPTSTSNLYKEIKEIVVHKNNYWIATDSGLVKCNDQYQVSKIILPQILPNATRGNYYKIKKIVRISDSILLLKSPSAIHTFNLNTENFIKTFTHTNDDKTSLPDIYFSDIDFVNSTCFATTDNGLLQLDYRTGDWSWVHQTFANSRLQCITSRNKELWIGTQTGLTNFNTTTKEVNHYYRKDGLSSDNILNLCLDSSNRLWIATTNGLNCFEPNKRKFTRLFKSDGLAENNLEGLLQADNNTIFVGTTNTITTFNANKVLADTNNIKAIITEILLNNENHTWIPGIEKNIEVPYANNNLTVHFTVPNYCATSSNKYYYLLEGADTTWQEVNTGDLQFTKLQSGTYTLYVSAKPEKSEFVDVLKIHVAYPFYKTWWFVLFCIVSSLTIIFFIYRIKAKALQEKIRLQKSFTQQLKEAEMQSLRSQMNPHFIFNTLNAINSFIVENKKEEASDYLVVFSKLIRNILENSRHESISLDKEITALKLYLQLEQVRLEQSFDYHITIAESIDTIGIHVPPLIIQPFVENAIWHGLRNKDTHGNVWVKIKQLTDEAIQIIIEDDGIGRSNASKLKANQKNHKSYGIEITQKRITLLHTKNHILIEDRMMDNVISGTIVTIHLQTA